MTSGMSFSAEYRRHREELLAAERALRDQQERVAELRRALPPGPEVTPEYVFQEGPADLSVTDPERYRSLRIHELFSPGRHELVAYHMMFDPSWADPCPMCNMWVDGLNGVAPHVQQSADLVVIAKAPLDRLRAWGRQRGWSRVRLVSSFGSDFNRDIGAEDETGFQRDMISVLTRDDQGAVRLFYTARSDTSDEIWRGIDPYCVTWQVLDMLPSGRGDWIPALEYPETA